MAKYLILIYGDEQRWADASEHWLEQNARAHKAFAVAAGPAVVGGHELEPTTAATSVRADSVGQPVITDGPFLETKEGLGGFYLLEAPDLDEAIRLAMLVPEATAPYSGIEIRPVRESG
jgi:hypothetical protein